jgi:hypothetical protein
MPKSVQGKAKQLIHEMYLAPRKAALAYHQFISSYQIKFPKACECQFRERRTAVQADVDHRCRDRWFLSGYK